MNYIAYLILRRLRVPLLTLIIIYSVSILGYVLIPGQDGEGNPAQMSFFHAFYFVSFMGSTIGFGEIPFEFTNSQRFWTLGAMYATVIGWLYSLGSVFAIFRDDAFLRLIKRAKFSRTVQRYNEPYYLVCGYGYTGSSVVRNLTERGFRCVVIDIDPMRIESLELDDLPFDVARLCADASDPEALQDAGIEHDHCIGILCLTNVDHVNLAVSIASKLLRPDRPVFSRVESQEYARNLASFGTDHIIDPFEIFSDYLNMAIHNPYRHLVYDWLTNPQHRSVSTASRHKNGNWIICGYGRFGKALKSRFDTYDDVTTIVIEPDPNARGIPEDGRFVKGLGTEAETLLEADIKNAKGIIAGTADDANNLSIIMTALELKPKLVTVARQNQRSNGSVFEAAKVDMIMEPNAIMSNHIHALLKTPLLYDFLSFIQSKDEHWCAALVKEFNELVGEQELDSWSVKLSKQLSPAYHERLRRGETLQLSSLYKHPHDRDKRMLCRGLLVKRGREIILSPADDLALRIDDEILICGMRTAYYWMTWALKNENVLRYILTGSEGANGYLWAWLKRIRGQA